MQSYLWKSCGNHSAGIWTETVGGLDIRRKYDINILAVKNEGEVSIAVSPNTVLIAGSTILVLGDYKAIQKCFHI